MSGRYIYIHIFNRWMIGKKPCIDIQPTSTRIAQAWNFFFAVLPGSRPPNVCGIVSKPERLERRGKKLSACVGGKTPVWKTSGRRACDICHRAVTTIKVAYVFKATGKSSNFFTFPRLFVTFRNSNHPFASRENNVSTLKRIAIIISYTVVLLWSLLVRTKDVEK